jgi:hypothetical protein
VGILFFERFWTVERRLDWDDIAFLVESHLVDTNFAVGTWYASTEFSVHIVFVDAMVANVPFIFAWNLEN